MKPLEGVKVVELATYLAAPSCARVLADWGADVIKVEPVEGDVYRRLYANQRMPLYEDGNPCYDNENANKKFIALNLKSPEGMEAFLKLVGQADVFITNNRPNALKKLKISYEDLSVIFPSLIFADILGYGEKGPDKDKPGFDYTTFYARSGLMADLVPRGQDVMNVVPGLGDHLVGLALVSGICAALYRKSITGQGDKIDAGLFQTGIYALSCGLMSAYFGRQYPMSRYEPNTPTSNSYKCKDGEWIFLAATDYPTQWPKICSQVFDRPDLINNEKFSTLNAALQNLEEVVKTVESIFATKDSHEWVELLVKADIAHEKVQHFTEVLKDPQAWANNYLREHTYPGGQKVVFANTPVNFKSIEDVPFIPSREIGADTSEILENLGYSKEQIEKMKTNGQIK